MFSFKEEILTLDNSLQRLTKDNKYMPGEEMQEVVQLCQNFLTYLNVAHDHYLRNSIEIFTRNIFGNHLQRFPHFKHAH